MHLNYIPAGAIPKTSASRTTAHSPVTPFFLTEFAHTLPPFPFAQNDHLAKIALRRNDSVEHYPRQSSSTAFCLHFPAPNAASAKNCTQSACLSKHQIYLNTKLAARAGAIRNTAKRKQKHCCISVKNFTFARRVCNICAESLAAWHITPTEMLP